MGNFREPGLFVRETVCPLYLLVKRESLDDGAVRIWRGEVYNSENKKTRPGE